MEENQNKAWQLSKQLASLIELQEPYFLQDEERDRFNVMVAQDFYNLFNAYNERYKNDKQFNKDLTGLLNQLETLLYEGQKRRLGKH